MNLSLGLGIGTARGGAAGPASLYTTADFVEEGTDPAYNEILGPLSWRFARNGTTFGRYSIGSVPSGSYRMTGTAVIYDGALAPVTTDRFEIADNFTRRFLVTPGAFDLTFTVASGTLRFNLIDGNSGIRVNDFFIEAA